MSTRDEFLISLGLLLLLTLAKTACANKVADFIEPFYEKFGFKCRPTWQPDCAADPPEELTARTESAFGKSHRSVLTSTPRLAPVALDH